MMVELRLSLLAVIVTVLAVIGNTAANPFRNFGGRLPSSPVRLTVHSPLSGTDIAISRAETLYPFLNPGIIPGDYFLLDQLGNSPQGGPANIGGKVGSGIF